MHLTPQSRVVIYAQDVLGEDTGKMASGILRYSPNPIVAVIDSRYAGQFAHEILPNWIPDSRPPVPIVASVDEAHALGGDVLVLGIAVLGGVIPDSAYPPMDRGVELGMSLINGLHDKLAPRYPKLNEHQSVWDIRHEPPGLGSGTAAARELKNKRVLFVGTDMAVGKMTVGLEIFRAALDSGIKSAFVATGQIGMTIMASGIPLDAIRVDFASGAVEREVMRYPNHEMILIEGQGSLLHPGSSATLPLIRGSCPTHMIMCHRAGMVHLRKAPKVIVPPLKDVIKLYEDLVSCCGAHNSCKCVGVALNTQDFNDVEAREHIDRLSQEVGLPVDDVVRFGSGKLLAALNR